MSNNDFDKFTIDLRMRPSKIFDQFEEEEQAQDNEDDPNAPPKFKVNIIDKNLSTIFFYSFSLIGTAKKEWSKKYKS